MGQESFISWQYALVLSTGRRADHFFVRMCGYRVTFGDFQVQQDQLHQELRRVSLARHSRKNGRPSKRSRIDGRFKIFLVSDDVDQTSLEGIEGYGDESHVQDVAVAMRILMSDWHPYDE